MELSDCAFCGLCAQSCPVGALLERRVERQPHQGAMKTVTTACPHCPLGCELVLNMDNERTRITRVTTDMNSVGAPNRGLTCLRGRYHFQDVTKNRLTQPMIGGKAVEWSEGIEKLAGTLKGSTAIFLGMSLTDQEISAVKVVAKNVAVAAKGFDAAKVTELLASFDADTPKGKVKPDLAELTRKMMLLSKAMEFEKNASRFPENLKSLYSMGANVRGLLDGGVVTHAPEEALKGAGAAIFVDCSPEDFGFTENALKGVKKVLLASSTCCEKPFDIVLPITAWAEREGTYTGALSGAKLPVHRGPLPPDGARALRWILAAAMRKLGIEVSSGEMAM